MQPRYRQQIGKSGKSKHVIGGIIDMTAVANQQGRRNTALRRRHAVSNDIGAYLAIPCKTIGQAISYPKISWRLSEISAGNQIFGACLPRMVWRPVKHRRRRWIYPCGQLQSVSRQDIPYAVGCRDGSFACVDRQTRQISCNCRWQRRIIWNGA